MSEAIDSERFHQEMASVRALIGAVGTQVAALTAEVRGDLAHGQRRMEDHELRIRNQEALMPERLSERLTSLESDRDKSRGSSGAVGRIFTAGIALASGGIGAAIIQAVHH